MAEADNDNTETWDFDQTFQYLTGVVRKPEAHAIDDLNRAVLTEQLLVTCHRRHLKDDTVTQGIVPSDYWRTELAIVRRDGQVVVEPIRIGLDQRYAFTYTVPASVVRQLWPQKQQPKRRKYRQDTLDEPLRRLYPPDGKVPDDVPTADLCHELGKAMRKVPSRDVINRKLGRRRD